MAHLNFLFILPFVLFVVQFECNEYTPVSATLDEDVAFHCLDVKLDLQSCYRVKWTKYPSNGLDQKVILVRPETPRLPDGHRVKWETGNNKPAFLLITEVQKSDEGVYSCEVWKGWESITVKNFTLKVKDCQSKSKTAAPGSVNLDCSDGSSLHPHNVSWYMLKGGHPVQLNAERFQKNGTTLSLKLVSASDSGWFRCRYWRGDTLRCLDINLLVQASPVDFTTDATLDLHIPSEEGFTTVHVVVVVFGIAITITLVGAVLYWKCNRKKVPHQTPECQDFEYDVVTYDEIDAFSVSDDFRSQCSDQQHHQDKDMKTWE